MKSREFGLYPEHSEKQWGKKYCYDVIATTYIQYIFYTDFFCLYENMMEDRIWENTGDKEVR